MKIAISHSVPCALSRTYVTGEKSQNSTDFNRFCEFRSLAANEVLLQISLADCGERTPNKYRHHKRM